MSMLIIYNVRCEYTTLHSLVNLVDDLNSIKKNLKFYSINDSIQSDEKGFNEKELNDKKNKLKLMSSQLKYKNSIEKNNNFGGLIFSFF